MICIERNPDYKGGEGLNMCLTTIKQCDHTTSIITILIVNNICTRFDQFYVELNSRMALGETLLNIISNNTLGMFH